MLAAYLCALDGGTGGKAGADWRQPKGEGRRALTGPPIFTE